MGRDHETIGNPAKGKYNIRNMAIMLALAFVGGLAAMGWVMTRWDSWAEKEQATVSGHNSGMDAKSSVNGTAAKNAGAGKPSDEVLPQNHAQALNMRVAELEDRISRVNVQAQAASGNAARAEGLLIAFAARRALDTGATLGYIEGQLRLRFGQAQPRAVATIINAAHEPVTLQDLQAGLDEIGTELVGRGRSQNWWADIKREVGHLVVFREATTPSALPERRLARAKRLLEAGRADAALAEVSRMPGRASGGKWMEQARRYIEARRALDLIETAAILEPRQLRATDGSTIDQPSPLAP
ncbi:MICOS complex subunit MIC60 [Rhizorhapis sp. SPR117]|uniref:MICOS complex subunit MIC60 n=1 Tax=Rhizorhapis sp. SPR117 TaxID=2912611 RepID=UPI001F312E97|nr:MICOS complex subunit MIC60 [Rhizorhapis sp. SPR117]